MHGGEHGGDGEICEGGNLNELLLFAGDRSMCCGPSVSCKVSWKMCRYLYLGLLSIEQVPSRLLIV